MDEVKFGSAPPLAGQAHLTIEYDIRKIDLFAAHISVVIRSRLLMLLVAILPTSTVWSTLTSAEVKGQPIAVKVLTAIAIYLAFFFVFFLLQTLWALGTILFRKHRGVLGRHTLQITDEGLIERTDVNEAIHKWAGMHKIVSGPKYLYIFVTETNAHMVPKRYFTSHGIQGFEGELRTRTAKARGQ